MPGPVGAFVLDGGGGEHPDRGVGPYRGVPVDRFDGGGQGLVRHDVHRAGPERRAVLRMDLTDALSGPDGLGRGRGDDGRPPHPE